MRADPTCPADDSGSTGPAVLGAVVVAPPWKPLDEPRRVAMDIITGSEDHLPTMRPTMASGRSKKASSDGGHSIPWRICAIPTPHGERIKSLGAMPSPPARATSRGRKRARAPLGTFSETPNVANPAARNVPHTNSQHRCKLLSLDVARTTVRNIKHSLSQHRKSFSQHCTHVAPRSTADRGLHPNPAA
jgi:hypothetical protein